MLEEWYSFDYILTNYTSIPKDKRLGLGRILAAYYINLELAWPLENLPSLLSWNDKVVQGTKSGILKIIDRKVFVNVLSLGYEPAIPVIMLLKEGHHLEAMFFLSHFMDVRSDLIVRMLIDSYHINEKTIAGNFFITRLYHLVDICIQNYKLVETIDNNNGIKMKIKDDAIKFSKSIIELDKIFKNEILLSTLNYSCKTFKKIIKSYDSHISIWNFCQISPSESMQQSNQKLYFILNIIMNLCFECHKLHEFLDILEVYLKINPSLVKKTTTKDIKEDGLKIDYDVLEKAFFSDKKISIFLDILLSLVKMEYTQNFKEKYESGNENESKTLLKEIYKLFGEKDSSINCLKLAIQNGDKFCEIAYIVLKGCRKIGKEKVMSDENNDICKYYEENISLKEEKKMAFRDTNLTFTYNEKVKSKPIIEKDNRNSKLLLFSYNLNIYKFYDDIIDNGTLYKRMYFISKIWTTFPLMSSGLIPLKINLEPKLFINLVPSENVLHHQDIINALNISKDFKSHDTFIEKITKTLNYVKKTVEEVENRNEIDKNELMVRYNNNYKDDKTISKINNHAIEDAVMMMSKARSMAKESVARERIARRDIKKQTDLMNSFKSKILEITISKDDVFPETSAEMMKDRDKEENIIKEHTKYGKNNLLSSENNEINNKEIKIFDKFNSLCINKEKIISSSNNSSNTSIKEKKVSACRMKRRVKRIRKNNTEKNSNFLKIPSYKGHNQQDEETSSLTISSSSTSDMKHDNYQNEDELIYPSCISLNIGPIDIIQDYLDKPSTVTRLDLSSITSPTPEPKMIDKKIGSPNVKDSYSQTIFTSPIVPCSNNFVYECFNTSEQVIPMSTRSESNTKNLPSTIIATTIPDWLCMLPLDSSRDLYSTRVLTIKDRNLLKEIKNKGLKHGLKKRTDFDSGFNDDIHDNFSFDIDGNKKKFEEE